MNICLWCTRYDASLKNVLHLFFCNYNANFDWLSDSLLLANMPQEIIIDSVIKMQIIASLERKTAGRRKKNTLVVIGPTFHEMAKEKKLHNSTSFTPMRNSLWGGCMWQNDWHLNEAGKDPKNRTFKGIVSTQTTNSVII